MIPIKSIYPLLSLFFFFFSQTTALVQPTAFGHYIRDLATTNETDFSLLASQWSVVVPAAATSFQQNSYWWCMITQSMNVGGPIMKQGGEIERNYSLAQHSVLLFSFTLVLSPDWLPFETIKIEIDNQEVLTIEPAVYLDTSSYFYCTDPQNLYYFNVYGGIYHTSGRITLRFSSSMTATGGFFGVRDIFFLAGLGSATFEPGAYILTSSSSTSPCPAGTFVDPDSGSFLPCDPACRNCYGPSEKECYNCRDGYSYNNELGCVKTCTNGCLYCNPLSKFCYSCGTSSRSPYLYWNNTCVATCPAPLVSEAAGNFRICKTPCQPDNFMLWDKTCRPSCDPPLVQRQEGQAKICDYPCPKNSSKYLYWNSSCLDTCPFITRIEAGEKFCELCREGNFLHQNNTCLPACSPPLVIRTEGNVSFCEFPCGLNSTKYLYRNGSCLDTCTSTVRYEGGNKFCDGCQPGYFLYDNNSCLPTCPPPMKQRIEGSLYSCDFPCNPDSNKYLYWNGSCLDNCTVNPRYEGGHRFCDACHLGSFLYENNTCLPSCIPPMNKRTEGKYSFCDFPCHHSALIYYHTEQQTCKQFCEYPLQVQDTAFCSLAISESEIKQVQAVTELITVGGDISSASATAAALISAGDPSAFSLVTLAKMLQYIKYINIRYPPKLHRSLKLQKTETGLSKWAPPMSQDMKEDFEYEVIPENFSTYRLHSSFLVNFWKPLMTLSLMLVVVAIIMLLVKVTSKKKKVNDIIKKVEQPLKWNFLITFFSTFYDDLVIYTSLDLRTVESGSVFSILSLVVCLLVNIISLFIILKGFLIAQDIMHCKRKSPSKSQPLKDEKIEEKWKDFQVFVTLYKDNSWFTQAFFPIFLVRVYLFSLILAYLYEYPLIQACFITLLSTLMLLYLISVRPFKEKVRLLQYITQEAIILVVNISVLILSATDRNGTKGSRTQEIIGDVILFCNTAFTTSGSVLLVLQNIVKVWNIYKAKKNAKAQTQNPAPKPNESLTSSIVLNSTVPGSMVSSTTSQELTPLKLLEPARVSKFSANASIFLRKYKPNYRFN